MKKRFMMAVFFVFSCSTAKQDCQKIILEEVEKYLNNINNIRTTFIQIDKNGVSKGYLIVKKPKGLARILYPSKLELLLKRHRITQYDMELKEKTETSTHSSPLACLLKKINFKNGDLLILKTQETESHLFVKIGKKDGEVNGAITFVFTKKPLKIVGWLLFEDKNDESPEKTIEVSFENPEINGNISDKSFEFGSPIDSLLETASW